MNAQLAPLKIYVGLGWAFHITNARQKRDVPVTIVSKI